MTIKPCDCNLLVRQDVALGAWQKKFEDHIEALKGHIYYCTDSH